jgi:hypothetical protein
MSRVTSEESQAGRFTWAVTTRASALRPAGNVADQRAPACSPHTLSAGVANGQLSPRIVSADGPVTDHLIGTSPAGSRSIATMSTRARPGGAGVERTVTPSTWYVTSSVRIPAVIGGLTVHRCEPSASGTITAPSYDTRSLLTRGAADAPSGRPAPLIRAGTPKVTARLPFADDHASRSSTSRSPAGPILTEIDKFGSAGDGLIDVDGDCEVRAARSPDEGERVVHA